LEKLGVLLGDRRKILRAIASLETTAKAAPSAIGAPVAVDGSPRDSAERRQVTVMFSDLVGSTALSARMDPEDLREVISAYQKCVAETVQRFGGFVAKYMGDGVLIYFGYPQAHEDDAERAVRAGLELVAAVSALKTHATLQTRVGIATGLVVVGDLIGSGASQEQAIVGETPNLAARLQGIAEPSSVVIAENTRRLVGNLFELENLGLQELKGISGPVSVWEALRPSSVESRFEAFHATRLTELVGRDEELELLLRRWSKAKTGQGQVVLLSGEPGIGKSRLTAALMEHVATEPHTRLRYFCSPQHTDSALYPIISQMEHAGGFAHHDTVKAKLDKLDALLAQSSTSQQDVGLFAEMLSLPNDRRYPTLELVPQQRRQKTLEALTAQLEALAHAKPVLTIFEDVHWVDPTSLEVISRTVDRLKTLWVLLIVTYRPEFEPPWIGSPFVTALNINRLGDREIAAMIDSVTGNKLLSGSIRQDIIERTDGIPLFAEEMTKAVLEAESQSAAERTAGAIPSSAVAVPATLQASLMARLDRLGPAKEVAQIGAVIGREFSHPLLAAMVRKPEPELQSALDRLVDAGLLFRQGTPPHASYLFKHALVQDAAYGTLLREPRRALHARIAATLESDFADIADNQSEVLARHYTEAGQIEKAAGLWGKAGLRSTERSALVEAVEQLTRALGLIEALPPNPDLRREQIKLQAALIAPLTHIKGYSASETKAAAERAHLLIEQAKALGEHPEDPLLVFSLLYSFWVASFVQFNGNLALNFAEQFLTLARKQTATAPLLMAYRVTGFSLFMTGELKKGLAHQDEALAIYNPADHAPLKTRFGQDARVSVLCQRSWCLWTLGYPSRALADAEEALHYAREISHAASLMYALFHAAVPHVFSGAYSTANTLVDQLEVFAKEKDAEIWKAGARYLRAWIAGQSATSDDALSIISDGLEAWHARSATVWCPMLLSYQASAYADVGQSKEAWRSLDEALRLIRMTNELWCEPEVHRISGEVVLKSPKADASSETEAHFERALMVARQQQAKSWELRAAMSLARL
jgi:class 3 adenylate cyclase/tetratricopeptide (TPR) repeat protein